MKIKIAERLRPFSHEPGTRCWLPNSLWQLQIFPALIRVFDWEQKLVAEVGVSIKPLDHFTVMLDLEKGGIRVFGDRELDYFIRVVKEPEILFLIESKKPLKLDPFLANEHNKQIALASKKGEGCSLVARPKKPTLSLGCHKAQDVEMMRRRLDLKEILPHWYRLGQGMTLPPRTQKETLLDQWHACDKREVVPLLKHLFQAGFSGIFCPRLKDEEFHGFTHPPTSDHPLTLLSEGAQLIQELFIKTEGKKVDLLPKLPPEFHAGRFIDLPLEGMGHIHFEWSKKLLTKVIFNSEKSQQIHFNFQKALKGCRLRSSFKERGQKMTFPLSLNVEESTTYYFDQFQK